MVRLRKQNGETVLVNKMEAVEILDWEGNLGALVLSERSGTIRILTPGDPLFTAYCRAHGTAVANVHVHQPFPLQPASLSAR